VSFDIVAEPVSDEASRVLDLLGQGLADRAEVHEFIADRAEHVTRDYLRKISATSHKTANRLGATPSGHLERAAESVTSTSDAEGATVTVTSPGITRAFQDITIKPGAGKKYLTIPATAEAYNRRAGSFTDLRLQFFKRGTLLALVKADQSSVATRTESGFSSERAAGGKGTVFYWLKKSVFQTQDRTLLPSDQHLIAAAEEGAADYLRALTLALESA
jgi:hypothetical protein